MLIAHQTKPSQSASEPDATTPCCRSNRPPSHMLLVLLLLLGSLSADAQDLTVTRLLSPSSGCQLSGAEVVQIEIQNVGIGTPGGSIYTLGFKVDDQAWREEIILMGNPVPRMGKFIHTFSMQRADLSSEGPHQIEATITYVNDSNPNNNRLPGIAVQNDGPSLGGTTSGNSVAITADSVQLQGQHGQIKEWQVSEDGMRWQSLENRTAAQEYEFLRAPTAFRAEVQNGACSKALSSIHWVSPDQLFSGDFE